MILFRAEKFDKEEFVVGYYIVDCETKKHLIRLQEIYKGVITGYQIKFETLQIKVGDCDWMEVENLETVVDGYYQQSYENSLIRDEKMKYRDHKSTLSESMKTVKLINSVNELTDHISTVHNRIITSIKFKNVGHDERIDWDTHYVMVMFEGSGSYVVVGISDGVFIV